MVPVPPSLSSSKSPFCPPSLCDTTSSCMDSSSAPRIAPSSSSHSTRSHSRATNHTASPSNSRVAHSSSAAGFTPSSSITGGDDSIMSSNITLAQALNSHAKAADPTRAALETILAERNNLSSQNSQLWNHLKKQRQNYALAVADVKRLRSERDSLKQKLEAVKGREDPEDRDMKASTSTLSGPGRSSTETTRDTDHCATLEASQSSLSHRIRPVRHFSEESPVKTRERSPLKDPQRSQTPTLIHSRSHEPLRGQERERSNTHPEFSVPDSSEGRASPIGLAPSSEVDNRNLGSESGKTSIDVIVDAPRPAIPPVPPTPLVIPTRSESLPSAATSSPPTSYPSPQSAITPTTKPLKVSPDQVGPPMKQSISNSVSSASATNSLSDLRITQHMEPLPVPMKTSNASTPSAPPVSLSTNFLAPHSRVASRESRISLPDEARRYLENYPDSPLSSPHANAAGGEGWNQSQAHGTNGNRALTQVPEEGVNRSSDNSPRPFLELETTDDSGSERRRSEETRPNDSESMLSSLATEETVVDLAYAHKRTDGLGSSQWGQTPKTRTSTVDQFPLPPSALSVSTSGMRGPTSPTSAYPGSTSQTSLSLPANTSFGSSNSTLAVDSNMNKRSAPRPDSFLTPINPPAATFRQMPLLNTDLKTATIDIAGSHIRANEKGKEVLSFVITVNVVGKEAWQIEKFYSDILALDNRLRSRCSRATVKKLAPLPENKLFKDNAPAKVDQRKQMLQAYLQSVMNLPIKDKNEIIVFFSSDVVRERSPVTQSGYKEGYLTKRGKNFGGWKTRYFVLHGPVLDYYESRGGAHLGSIQVSGAQIGRQQRAGGSRDSDDENEYRHAFLIIEQKKGPAGQNIRHVLCAESDKERDSWVDVLVRYVMGQLSEEERTAGLGNQLQNGSQPRSSTSSFTSDFNATPSRKGVAKEVIQKSSVQPIPIALLSQDKANAKFFQSAPFGDDVYSSPAKSSTMGPSPIERSSTSSFPFGEGSSKISLDKSTSSAITAEEGQLLSSSLPTSSNLDVNTSLAPIGQRANSELGHYPDLLGTPGKFASPEHLRQRERVRASYHPSLGTVMPSPTDRAPSPDSANSGAGPSPSLSSRQMKISAPTNGTPIPAGFKFGSKESEQPVNNDRERKAKSRNFWRWPTGSEKAQAVPTLQSRAVFGVPLEESLAVSQIANLPSIVFRCIQYLEANKADQEEGIYRLSGSSALIKNLKDKFNAEGDVDLLKEDDVRDPHAIAGLLKSFLRELPASLLTHDLHMRFLAVMDFVDTQERVKELQELISQLPLANYSLLRALTAHLILIVQNSNINKMTMRNVGIVFSPTLGIPAGVFSLMLGEFSSVFNVNGEGTDSPIEEEAPDHTAPSPKRLSGLSRRNSKQYTDGAADQLLGLSGRVLPATEEDRSDDGDTFSVHTESGAETTEAETAEGQTIESYADSVHTGGSGSGSGQGSPNAPMYQEQVHPPPSGGSPDATPQKSRASNVAASRGLNIAVLGEGSTVNNRRHSRMLQGLPASPRPQGYSPLNTPTSGPKGDSPSLHTPK